jgi:hypothetical protein
MLRNNRTIHVLLAAIAFLLGANLLINLHQDRTAIAQGLPDSGAQLQQQIDQLANLNKKMDKLQSLLESGKLTVKVAEMPPAAK